MQTQETIHENTNANSEDVSYAINWKRVAQGVGIVAATVAVVAGGVYIWKRATGDSNANIAEITETVKEQVDAAVAN